MVEYSRVNVGKYTSPMDPFDEIWDVLIID